MTMTPRSYFDRPRATNGTAAIVFALASAAIVAGPLFANERAKPPAEKETPQPVELVVDAAPAPLPRLPFPLSMDLGTLVDGLGCFPFDNEA